MMTIKNLQKIFLISILFAGFLFACPALAEEIDNFNVAIKINPDSSIEVTENILYNFGGLERHGIYRDIPIKYKARLGRYNLKISDIKVADDKNSSCQFETSNSGDNIRIKIGDPDSYVTGMKTYVISYRIEKAINYFDSHDELYWNATGNDWEVPINQAQARVWLPQEIETDQLQAACFAGYFGSTAECSETYVSKDNIRFVQTAMAAGQGLTIVAGWPKGIVYQPTALENAAETVLDNSILGLPILILIFSYLLWRAKGKDPAGQGTIIHQYNAPDNLTPAEVGVIVDEKINQKDISAEIINLAIRGYLKIHRRPFKGLLDRLSKSDNYILEKLKDESILMNEFEKKLMAGLFKPEYIKTHKLEEGDIIGVKLSDLKDKFYTDLNEIKKDIFKSVIAKGYFTRNPQTVMLSYFLIAISITAGLFTVGIYYGAAGIISAMVSGLIMLVFSFIMPRKTKKGVLAKEHILGLKIYLNVAEKDRIKFHNAPEKNSKLFEKLLPFAMVLGVENQWAEQFKDIYNKQPDWYSDPSGRSFSSGYLVGSLNSFSSSASSSLSSQPSSSASGGGSGFSGGGGGGGLGGGGGGSW